jgi:hypothetical protein
MNKENIMKRTIIGVSVLLLLLLLSGCFAFLPQSDGYLSMDLKIPPEARGVDDRQVVIFVANAEMEESIKELLWLIGTEADEDRLVDVAVAVANRGLVKFGGDPFLRTTIHKDTTSGSFRIPGVPAGRSYFVKVFVFLEGQDIKSVEDLVDATVVLQNFVFNGEEVLTDYSGWVPIVPFPIEVEAGKTTRVFPPVDLR